MTAIERVGYAKLDRPHVLAPIFQPIKAGKRPKLDVEYWYGEFEKWRFVGFEQLGPEDMRVLQGIVAISGPEGVLLEKLGNQQMELALDAKLERKWDATRQNSLVAKTSYYQLLDLIGQKHKDRERVEKCLLRLGNVTAIVTRGQMRASFHLLSWARDNTDGRLYVALNPRLTSAILGQVGYSTINMDEVRALASNDRAALIHQRLCGFIDPGKEQMVGLEKMLEWLYSDESPNKSTQRARKHRLKQDMEYLSNTLNWSVTEEAGENYRIRRPN